MTAPPRVGVGVFVFEQSRGGRFLIGKRKGSLGADTWALPGGHLEHGESLEQCAVREVEEEAGIRLGNPYFLTATNTFFREDRKHYVTIFMIAQTTHVVGDQPQQAQLLEPEKCEGWTWSTYEEMLNLQDNQGNQLFLPLISLRDQRPDVCTYLRSMGEKGSYLAPEIYGRLSA
ncbi:dihydroneopterin triphosphate pyrophosphohydrolase activity protein [Recurvomyces mirabilis]|uniref:Dihydroneopterin triphosphate pyrophosphohydrolase activity protein n=1 Tax=Recurvomyces mirabilis TaxID=574656 RepID=A0AAE0WKA4_9PEZI|nr:dihydroneopterin triphosphate pyrophosphohydrolase activity protein [Recurvomyces mirabilis]KAK5153177.1 hypothetical protein LTS14_007822 [Recurvomyces mirabilis]